MTDSIKAPKPGRHLRSPRSCGWGFLAPSLSAPTVHQIPAGHSHFTSRSVSHMPSLGGITGAAYATQPRDSLRREGYTVQVNVNDYLDIYCPHYNSSGVGPGAGPGPGGGAEQYVLYMVSRAGYRTCNASQGFKRWECNRPHAPHSPIKFSEKFQRYSAFSLGYEFHAGHEYYYISTPTHNLHWKCLRMKVFVCCASTSHSGEKPVPTLPQFTMGPNVKINVLEDFEGENRQVPKLEKSISGTSPKREHLPLAVGIAFFLMTLLAS
ncbi:PREDICTED: ephrin-A3 isoform X1 [Ceratotherium simum simum]|uniref:Ephrin-A3 isoform X1 n=1 Tax=Ceratotherium simum simum TaxID=73337 RepID=A0ABM1D6K3_CERSS|nr:PREDICTED: ephrin-A3 isoform X1 [Ceratotherium simum simum]